MDMATTHRLLDRCWVGKGLKGHPDGGEKCVRSISVGVPVCACVSVSVCWCVAQGVSVSVCQCVSVSVCQCVSVSARIDCVTGRCD
eukprot:3567943-Alexandrium_andersonii.AAC.1